MNFFLRCVSCVFGSLVTFFQQTPTRTSLWVPYSLWATRFSWPAALTAAFASQTLGLPPLLSFTHHRHPQVNQPSGGPTPLLLHSSLTVRSSGSLPLDGPSFQTGGIWEESCVRLSWTSKHVPTNWRKPRCRGLQRWMDTSLCQVSFCRCTQIYQHLENERVKHIGLTLTTVKRSILGLHIKDI